MRKLRLTLLSAFFMLTIPFFAVTLYDGSNPVSYNLNATVVPVVNMAAEMFRGDIQMVTGLAAVADKNGVIQVYQLDADRKAAGLLAKAGCPVDDVRQNMDAFWIGVSRGKVLVAGNNGRGCAYGMLELSRMAGVSPWVWWGDVVPEHKDRLTTRSPPSRNRRWPTGAFSSTTRTGAFATGPGRRLSLRAVSVRWDRRPTRKYSNCCSVCVLT